uniref:Uncharacterized protein n=1 Tax=Anguilla anguilla TaxID=7936 RepID=A0A0E9TFD2_ANGAN
MPVCFHRPPGTWDTDSERSVVNRAETSP